MARISDIKNIINQAAQSSISYNNGSTVKAIEPKVKEPVINLPAQQQTKLQPAPKPQSLAQYIKTALVAGKDYGTVPGIKDPFLFKSGAVKIMRYLGLTQHVDLLDKQISIADKLISYTVKVSLVSQDGIVITEAIGSANSLEGKFIKSGMSSDPLVANMAAKRALTAAIKMLL